MSDPVLIYSSKLMGLPDLYILTDEKSGFFGWLMFKHPDGQLVSLADLKPHVGELQRFIPVSERPPEKSGDYLCKMMDARDGYDEEWLEVVHYKVSQAFKSTWNTCSFDEVMEWMPVPGSTK